MKKSRYNIFFEENGQKFVFNSLTCAFAQVDDNFHKNLECAINGEKIDSLLLNNMKKSGIIIEDDFDEIKILKFNNQRAKFEHQCLALTIVPTMACNFACPYCYETPDSGIMRQDVFDAILKKVEEEAQNKKPIYIYWYGGEPLLVKDMIWKYSEKFIEICKKYNVPYTANMVTNGYLIDDETILKFLEFNIENIQITIDGPPEIHNARRKLKSSTSPTFAILLKNSKKALEKGINVSIRINTDKTNVNEVYKLVDIFNEYDLNNAYIYLGQVEAATDTCKSISEVCLNKEEYSLKRVEFEKFLLSKGFKHKDYPSYPKVKGNYCCADKCNSYIIVPNGDLYKCWHQVNQKDFCVGNIKSLQKNPKEQMTEISYILSSPFENKKCLDCNVLPLCMGGCPTSKLDTQNHDDQKCDYWKYNLIDALKLQYISSLG